MSSKLSCLCEGLRKREFLSSPTLPPSAHDRKPSPLGSDVSRPGGVGGQDRQDTRPDLAGFSCPPTTSTSLGHQKWGFHSRKDSSVGFAHRLSACAVLVCAGPGRWETGLEQPGEQNTELD